MPKAEGYQGKNEDTIVLNNEDLESQSKQFGRRNSGQCG